MDMLEEKEGIESSTKVINLVRENKIYGCISALTVPILWFLVEKNLSEVEARVAVKEATRGFSIVPLTSEILNKAFSSKINDFEDAIQLHSGLKGKCNTIVTRNKKDFVADHSVQILTPEEFLQKNKL